MRIPCGGDGSECCLWKNGVCQDCGTPMSAENAAFAAEAAANDECPKCHVVPTESCGNVGPICDCHRLIPTKPTESSEGQLIPDGTCDCCGMSDATVEMGGTEICESCAWYAYVTIQNFFEDMEEREAAVEIDQSTWSAEQLIEHWMGKTAPGAAQRVLADLKDRRIETLREARDAMCPFCAGGDSGIRGIHYMTLEHNHRPVNMVCQAIAINNLLEKEPV